jgi:hypothetical protein
MANLRRRVCRVFPRDIRNSVVISRPEHHANPLCENNLQSTHMPIGGAIHG